jgi:hypothetical protein
LDVVCLIDGLLWGLLIDGFWNLCFDAFLHLCWLRNTCDVTQPHIQHSTLLPYKDIASVEAQRPSLLDPKNTTQNGTFNMLDSKHARGDNRPYRLKYSFPLPRINKVSLIYTTFTPTPIDFTTPRTHNGGRNRYG